DGLRRKVFLDRYALKDARGEPLETYPEQMWRRVAGGIAAVEPDETRRTLWAKHFYDLLSGFKFVPGGRILSGAGTEHEVTYYNCYVVGIGEDPLDPTAPKQPQLDPEPARHAFYTALSEMTDIMARSGGVGMNLSSLPPAGTRIAQPERGRHGAQRPVLALSIAHPDIEILLDQRDQPLLSHVDLAVIVPQAFDQALATDAEWSLSWPDRPRRTVSARALWERLHQEHTRPVRVLRPAAEMLVLDDSRESIVAGARDAALALFAGRSPVVDFSRLRPKGAYIKTVNGTSSGPVAWMYLFDALAQSDNGANETEQGVIWFGEIASTITGKTIQQGGSRRGALMLMLNDDHPDVEAFVTAKRIDPVTNRPVMLEHANLSVCVSDGFMAAVKADLPWDLRWQGQVVRTIRARGLWEQICAAAWATAEPGVVFMQRAREQSPMWYRENIRCTNPCVTGETLVYTAAGLYPAAELAEMGSSVIVASPGEFGVSMEQATHVWESGTKPVFRLRTTEGYSLRLTADHKVLTTDGWVEARHLVPGQKIRMMNGEGGFGARGSLEEGRILGWLVGEGHITNRGSGQQAAILAFWGAERVLATDFAEMVNRLVASREGAARHAVGVIDVPERDESRIRSVRLLRFIDPELVAHKTQVPPSVLRGSRQMQVGFLQALFTADGTVGGSTTHGLTVHLASSCLSLLEGVQRVLLNLGVASRIYAERRVAGSSTLPDGKGGLRAYTTEAQHELVISKASVGVFAREVSFLPGTKAERLAAGMREYTRGLYRQDFLATFESLVPDGEEPVYDLTEPTNHLFVANGLVMSNCGEQPLPAGAVCNLGALNLACYVDDDGNLDEPALRRDAAVATRFLDNVIDATPYFSELHVKMQREGTRRIGLGTMGLADALIKMRVSYGSPQSLEAIDRIYGIVRDATYRASVALAEEKEPCGFFERDRYLESPFIETLPEDIRAGIAAHGVRNGVLLTQAPTGTTSLLAGVSSGIEPVFDFAIKRTDRLGEHIIYHPLYEAWRQAHGDEPDPEWFRSARDLTPEDHVQVQARVQRYTDSSISKTANAPNSHTAKDVAQLYNLAYDLGCKGVTYYREGSRDAVLSSANEHRKAPAATVTAAEPAPIFNVASTPQTSAPTAPASGVASAATPPLPATVKPRPQTVFGYTRRVKAPEGTANITINSDEEGPLEVFINVGRAGSDIAALAEAMGRLISLSLRLPSPMPPEERLQQMATQLRGIGGSRSIGFGAERVLSLPDAVAQALTWHLQQGLSNVPAPISGTPGRNGQATPMQLTLPTLTPTGNICPQCGSGSAYVMEEGCKKCHSCGYSEC
ncbi:MAG TPA: ribonucleotide reductase N-terminal alpha domain-containing protein, partial [Chloroflexota bacterium]|nr:ribonucleotide reductase N-terminal alpha domain-containing protein [Chloroflexota bacterium]